MNRFPYIDERALERNERTTRIADRVLLGIAAVFVALLIGGVL